ncbi:MAG: hypothetical protein FJ276_37675 [Planctomycetes bacterium]|nr:hypothetical protein [Planctomycetota bacterium]
MTDQIPIPLQQGIFIDQDRLAEAGLRAPLEVLVEQGEIRIRSAARPADSGARDKDDHLLALAGMLLGSPLSATEIEVELYGEHDPPQ